MYIMLTKIRRHNAVCVLSLIASLFLSFSLLRKVKDESATGSSTSNRVRTTLTLSVENIEYDTSACQLRVKGRNIQENQYVKVSTKKYPLELHTHTLTKTKPMVVILNLFPSVFLLRWGRIIQLIFN